MPLAGNGLPLIYGTFSAMRNIRAMHFCKKLTLTIILIKNHATTAASCRDITLRIHTQRLLMSQPSRLHKRFCLGWTYKTLIVLIHHAANSHLSSAVQTAVIPTVASPAMDPLAGTAAPINEQGKRFCPSKKIPEETLKTTAAEVLGLEVYDASVFTAQIAHILVPGHNQLTFVFKGGHMAHRTWLDRSRRDSWTPEMREKARQRRKA